MINETIEAAEEPPLSRAKIVPKTRARSAAPKPYSSMAMSSTWTHRRADGERGLFAREDIDAGVVVVVFGGRVINQRTLDALSRDRQRFALQIETDAFLYSDYDGPGDWVNHSCAPNLGLLGQVVLVTLEPVREGEELTFDYAMTDATDYDSFICGCGAELCRGKVTGNDWRRPDLQERYRGRFAPHIQRLIDAG